MLARQNLFDHVVSGSYNRDLTGMGATGYFFYRGMRAASAGESLNLAAMLQKRVMGQFSTLAIIIASFTYYMAQSPDAMKNSEIDTRALNARG